MPNQEQNVEKKAGTLTEVLQDISHCCKHSHNNRMSFFQLRYFLIDTEPTHDAKVWKCQSELKARAQSIEELLDDIEEVKDQIQIAQFERNELKESQIPEELKQPKLRMIERKIRKLHKGIESLEERIAICSEEAIFILSLYQSLVKLKPARAYDDISAQNEYWNSKLSEDLQLRLLLHKPIEVELAKTIMALNDSCSIKQTLRKIINQINTNTETKVERIENDTDIKS